MYIDITEFFNDACPSDYQSSVAEIGWNAGALTWAAALDDAPDYPLLNTEEKRDAFREYVRGFGAWSGEEIAAWSDIELTALFIQAVSADMREFNEIANGDWRLWENWSMKGLLAEIFSAVHCPLTVAFILALGVDLV